MNTYHIADDNGQQRGPFPIDQLLGQGVRPTTMVWSPGMASWLPAAQVPEVAAALGQAAQAFASPQQAQPAYSPQAYAPQQPQYPVGGGYQPGGQFPQPGQYAQPVQYAQGAYPSGYMPTLQEANSKKMAAGLCGILLGVVGLGGLGIHKFVLGLTTPGIIYLVVSIVGGVLTCGVSTGIMSLIGLVEGIIYLTKSDQDFLQQYMIEKKQWF